MEEIFAVDIRPHIEGFSEIMLHCDYGKEFYNADVAVVLAGLHIQLCCSHSDHKAAVVERVIRTKRERLVKAREMKGEKWISLIARVVDLYNHACHRSIGMTPFEALGKFPLALFQLAECRERENRTFSRGKARFSIGDVFQLKIQDTERRKGTLKEFTNEVYQITRVRKTPYKYVYTVETMENEKVHGQFDTHTLKADVAENMHIVNVLGERMRNGNRDIRVHWDGYAQSADEWVDARQVHEEN